MLKPRERRILKSHALVTQERLSNKVAVLSEAADKRLAAFVPPDVHDSLLAPIVVRERREVLIQDRSIHAEIRSRSLHKRRVSKRWGQR